MRKQLRVEISFKDLEQLKNKIEFLLDKNIFKINIPCKGLIKKDFLLEVVSYIGTNYKEAEIIYHYSLFHQFSKNKNNSLNALSEFINYSKKYNNKEILLVSGSRKKKNFEVSNILNAFEKDIKFGVAYNPYFDEKDDISLERENLIKKINSGLVNSIWLQFGSNHKSLYKEINFIKEIIANKSKIFKNDIRLYGSIFIPSKQFLARFKFRPWRGVFLSNDFLNSLEYSYLTTKEIYKIYCQNNITPLIETECSNIKQFNQVENLLKGDF